MSETHAIQGARWGQIVLVVAESYQQAWEHKMEREADPNDQYIYRIPHSVVDILGMRPPDIVRVDELGNWTERYHYNSEFVRKIRHLQGEIKGYERTQREARQARKVKRDKGGGG
jgi:hypothetical protein